LSISSYNTLDQPNARTNCVHGARGFFAGGVAGAGPGVAIITKSTSSAHHPRKSFLNHKPSSAKLSSNPEDKKQSWGEEHRTAFIEPLPL